MKHRTNEELAAEYAASGDDSVFEELYRMNRPLVLHILDKRIRSIPLRNSEVESIGMLALRAAIVSYDPNKGAKFSSVYVREIKNQLKFHFRSRLIHVPKASRSNAAAIADGGDVTAKMSAKQLHSARMGLIALTAMADVSEASEVADQSEERSSQSDIKTMLAVLGTMDERSRRLLTMKFGLDGKREKSYRQIGGEFGFTPQAAEKAVKKAVAKLRETLL